MKDELQMLLQHTGSQGQMSAKIRSILESNIHFILKKGKGLNDSVIESLLVTMLFISVKGVSRSDSLFCSTSRTPRYDLPFILHMFSRHEINLRQKIKENEIDNYACD